jgi:hypothetical protein
LDGFSKWFASIIRLNEKVRIVVDGDGQKQEVEQIGKLNLLQVRQPLTNARRLFPTDAQLTGSIVFSDTVAVARDVVARTV